MKTKSSLPVTTLKVGDVYPVSPHAVVVHLPSVDDVKRYETGCPVLKTCVTVGYPRFVLHQYICQIQEYIGKLLSLFCKDIVATDQLVIIPCCNTVAAQSLLQYVSTTVTREVQLPSSSSSPNPKNQDEIPYSNPLEYTNHPLFHTGLLSSTVVKELSSKVSCSRTNNEIQLSLLSKDTVPTTTTVPSWSGSSSPTSSSSLLSDYLQQYQSFPPSLTSSSSTASVNSLCLSNNSDDYCVVVFVHHTSSSSSSVSVFAADEEKEDPSFSSSSSSFSPVQPFLQRCKEYQQHTGCRISSRQAEDILYSLHLIPSYHTEDYYSSPHTIVTSSSSSSTSFSSRGEDTRTIAEADTAIRTYLQSLFPRNCTNTTANTEPKQQFVDLNDIRLYNSGMAGFTSLFLAVQQLWYRRSTSLSQLSSSSTTAVLQSCSKHPYSPHRDLWLQLGWLYLDTTEVMRKMYTNECRQCHPTPSFSSSVSSPVSLLTQHPSVKLQPGLIQLFDPGNQELLVSILQTYGSRLAGIITECPTNPLVQTCNIPSLVSLIRTYAPESIFIIDPTMMGLSNGNVLSLCDVIMVSLTKYASNEGDIMAGALILNPDSSSSSSTQVYSSLRNELFTIDTAFSSSSPSSSVTLRISPYWQKLYYRDTLRLAYEIAHTDTIVKMINTNTCALVDWFYQSIPNHPTASLRSPIGKVHWAYSDTYAANYTVITKSYCKPGSMVTIELEGTWVNDINDDDEYSETKHNDRENILGSFYDNLAVVKGPSFGTIFTIASPFIYLAHYDLVSTKEGRKYLYTAGVNPYLIRISVGCEPIEDIIRTFDTAIRLMKK